MGKEHPERAKIQALHRAMEPPSPVKHSYVGHVEDSWDVDRSSVAFKSYQVSDLNPHSNLSVGV